MEAPPHDIMAVADISARNDRYIDKTTRHIDPLDPQYTFNGMYIGDDSYTKPSKPRPLIQDSSLLKTRDIAGAYPNWGTHRIHRRDYRNTNFIGDIQGAHADTIRPGIVTRREVNPLDPVYQSLDRGELLQSIAKPLIPADFIKVPTINFKKEMASSFKGNIDRSDLLSQTKQLVIESMRMSRQFSGNDLDPVSFTSHQDPSIIHSKSNLPQFNLDLSRGDPSGLGSGRFKSSNPSPSVTGRSSGGGLTSNQRRAIQDKMDEVNLVRQLQRDD